MTYEFKKQGVEAFVNMVNKGINGEKMNKDEMIEISKQDFRHLIDLVKKRIRIDKTFKWSLERLLTNTVEDDFNQKIEKKIIQIKKTYNIKFGEENE